LVSRAGLLLLHFNVVGSVPEGDVLVHSTAFNQIKKKDIEQIFLGGVRFF